MQRSHSRESFPLDKRVPKMPKQTKPKSPFWYQKSDSEFRQLMKHMHKKKQRQYNRKLSLSE